MHHFDRFMRILAALALVLAFATPGEARSRKAEKYMADGKKAEERKDWDRALDFYEKALTEDPGDPSYQLSVKRVRFEAGQAHVDLGRKLRERGELDQALLEFEKAAATDPASQIARQELRQTMEMIERAKKSAAGGTELTSGQKAMTPFEIARKKEVERLDRMESPPELRPLSQQPINLRMANQPPKVLFETVVKLAGINVVFDPDYGKDQNAAKTASVELVSSSLDDALDYIATMTKSYWKPLSPNAIFVTQDNQQKRREYEDNAVKVFYLSNLTTPQELQEVSTAIRLVTGANKVITYSGMNALVIRGTTDQVMLSEKLINDLDKPKSEVIVDILVLEASRTRTRSLAAAIAGAAGAAGLNTQIQFSPRNPVLLGGSNSSSSSSTGTTTTGSTTQQLISLARVGHISTNDFSVTLPGALLQAVMGDNRTRVLQAPQIRASNGQKASLRIGDKLPVAQGGFQPFGATSGGVGGYGSLYQQFQFIDVGVNVDITPMVHGTDEVTLKVVMDISQKRGDVSIGGITQPIIGQRKIEHEIRLKEGEVNLVGGLQQLQTTKQVSGIPGLSSIPVVRRLFSSESTEKDESELMIALIPHIVRTPGINEVNLRAILAGTEAVTRLSYSPQPDAAAKGGAPAAAGPAQPVAPAPGVTPALPAAPAQQPAAPVRPAQAPAPAHLLFRPWTSPVQAGSTFTLQLDVDNVSDLVAAPFHLKFDPQILRLQEVKAGPMLSSDGQKVIFTRNILNDTGDATVNLNRLPGTGGVNGSGTLAVLTFQAIKAGTANVTFSDLAARNSQSQAVTTDVPHAEITVK